MKRKIIWKIVLIAGLFPFAAVIVSGIYKAAAGFAGLAVSSPPAYGISAFLDWVVLASFVYWPAYLVGLILIVAAAVMLTRKK